MGRTESEHMKLFYFDGGPVEGQQDAFFRRLAEIGGSPAGWRLYPHASRDGRALHLVEARGEEEIDAHLAQFGPIYERGPIVEVVQRPDQAGR
ncbi:MAG TPA: hypothetical protein VFS53_00615 [Gemmatimonadota bacterium]|nr:hypothetical protein [Gemmatimonadota bacterium]